MRLSNNLQAFLALVRARLWESNVQLSQFDRIKFEEVYRLAEEQSVVGLIVAGIDYVCDAKVPKEIALQFVGTALSCRMILTVS